MGISVANLWDQDRAKELARDLVGRGYCGPAVVIWIAAVWNIVRKNRRYDHIKRVEALKDGPRLFEWHTLGNSLNEILKQETDNDLCLDSENLIATETMHKRLEKHDMPIIIRLTSGVTPHYVTLYKSELTRKPWYQFDTIKLYYQDNGTLGRDNGGNPGLYATGHQRSTGNWFPLGARRVKVK